MKRMVLLTLALIVPSFLSGVYGYFSYESSDDIPWPQFQRDVYHTGCTPEIGAYGITIRDYKILWSYDTGHLVWSLRVADIDGDGEREIIAGTWGSMYALRPDGTVQWENPVGDALIGLSIGDVNNDGELEISAGTCNPSAHYNKIYLFGKDGRVIWEYIPTKENEWIQQPGLIGFTTIADVDGGKPEILVGMNGDEESGLYSIHSSKSFFGIFWDVWGPPRAHQLWFFKTGWWTKMPPAVIDLDGNGRKEIIIISFDMRCYCLDSNGNKMWEFVVDGGPQDEPPIEPPVKRAIDSAPTIADLNGDKSPEILFATHDESYGSNLYALTSDGKLFWKHAVGTSGSSPTVADINNDGVLEVIVGDYEGNVHAFDNYGNEIWRCKVHGRVRDPSVADLDGDGYKEIVVGTVIMEGIGDGYVYILSHEGEILWQFHAGSKQMADNVVICDINNDGFLELIAGFENGKIMAFSPLSIVHSLQHTHCFSLNDFITKIKITLFPAIATGATIITIRKKR